MDEDALIDRLATAIADRLDTRPLLSVPQLAEKLAVSERKAWELVEDKKGPPAIPSIMVGGNRRVAQSDVDAYVASCRQAD